MQKNITFSESILSTIKEAMLNDKNLCCIGLGVRDPLGIFGTTKNLKDFKSLENRIIEPPTSENCITGVSVGMAIDGLKVIITHQRVDFSLYSMDQIINSAAKWYYMFNGQSSINITIRMIIGKGWGQGPTHSQSLHSLFAQIPGLKVVIPSSPKNVKGLLNSAIKDPNPVLFLEHRWLYQMYERVPNKIFFQSFKSKVVRRGQDITIVTFSYLVFELLKISNFLSKNYQIDIELIDLSCISPNNYRTILNSFEKTKKAFLIDIGHDKCSIMKDIAFELNKKKYISNKIVINAMPDCPVPSSHHIAKYLYPDAQMIVNTILKIINFKIKIKVPKNYLDRNKDIPGNWFKGPF